jgi:hypothetical protein
MVSGGKPFEVVLFLLPGCGAILSFVVFRVKAADAHGCCGY